MNLSEWARLNGWSEPELNVYLSQLEILTCEKSCYYSFDGVCARDHKHGIGPKACFIRHQDKGYMREIGSDEIEAIESGKANDK